MEPNQIDILTLAMLCYLEQVQHAKKPGIACQFWSRIDGLFLTEGAEQGMKLDLPRGIRHFLKRNVRPSKEGHRRTRETFSPAFFAVGGISTRS